MKVFCLLGFVLALLAGCATAPMQSTEGAIKPDAAFTKVYQLVGNIALTEQQTFDKALLAYRSLADFHCRQPIYARYFDRRFGAKNTDLACPDEVAFSVFNQVGQPELLRLDPERVSAVHLLFAGNGKAMASRFGHVSLRLVVCPEDDRSEQACESNLYEHLVVGFRAHIDELMINSLKGLMGSYQSYLFAHHFMDVYREYAIGEFRELQSLPLKLSAQDRTQLVRSFADVHWSYAGNYKFLTQNCSTLLQKALLSQWPELAADKQLSEVVMRPDVFFNTVKASELADGQRLVDLAQAETTGHYFPSTEAVYQSAFRDLNAASGAEFEKLEHYLKVNPVKRYKQLATDADFILQLRQQPNLTQAWLLLEELSMLRYERYTSAHLSAYFDHYGIEQLDKHLRRELDEEVYQLYRQCVLEPVQASLSPIVRFNGIPMAGEQTHNGFAPLNCQKASIQVRLKPMRQVLAQKDKQRWFAVQENSYYWVESLNNIERIKRHFDFAAHSR